MSDANTTQIPASERSPWSGAEPLIEAFVIAWSAAEPHRAGEIAVIATPGTSVVLGRGLGEGSTAMEPRVRFFRQRPAKLEEQPPIMSPGISRRQLVIHAKVGGGTAALVKTGAFKWLWKLIAAGAAGVAALARKLFSRNRTA